LKQKIIKNHETNEKIENDSLTMKGNKNNNHLTSDASKNKKVWEYQKILVGNARIKDQNIRNIQMGK